MWGSAFSRQKVARTHVRGQKRRRSNSGGDAVVGTPGHRAEKHETKLVSDSLDAYDKILESC